MPHSQVFLHVSTRQLRYARKESLKERILIRHKAKRFLAIEVTDFLVKSQQTDSKVLKCAPLTNIEVSGQLLIDQEFMSAIRVDILDR